MVKRAISIVVGAAAGAALWFALYAVLTARSEADPSMDGCVQGGLVECIGYETPQRTLPPARPSSPIAVPCKGWLNATGEGAMAMLSQCLHQARRGGASDDAAGIESIRRRRAIAASS